LTNRYSVVARTFVHFMIPWLDIKCTKA